MWKVGGLQWEVDVWTLIFDVMQSKNYVLMKCWIPNWCQLVKWRLLHHQVYMSIQAKIWHIWISKVTEQAILYHLMDITKSWWGLLYAIKRIFYRSSVFMIIELFTSLYDIYKGVKEWRFQNTGRDNYPMTLWNEGFNVTLFKDSQNLTWNVLFNQ